MLLNHNYAIETFLKELYHLHTFYSFKCSVIFTTDKIAKHSKIYIYMMLLNHNYAIETFLKELYHLHTFYSLNVHLSSQLTKFQNILKCIYHGCLIIIMLLKHS